MVTESTIRVGPLRVEWAAAQRGMPGEEPAGDRYAVIRFPGGVLAAVVDGLGYGAEAATPADRVLEILERHPAEPVAVLALRCHEALARMRGAVMALASFDATGDSLTWLGVGSVRGLLLHGTPVWDRTRTYLVPFPGVVGARMPSLRPSVVPVARGDLLLLVTDGVEAGFAEAVGSAGTPRQIAESILAQYARETDEALVLVARCLVEPTRRSWRPRLGPSP